MSASEEVQLSEKLVSAMDLTKEESTEVVSNSEALYTSESRGSDDSGEGTFKVVKAVVRERAGLLSSFRRSVPSSLGLLVALGHVFPWQLEAGHVAAREGA